MKMESTLDDCGLLIASQALENDTNPKIREAARVYAVPRTTLTNRRNGVQAQSSANSKKRKLTKLEEEAIVQRVLELDAQGFPPRMSGVEDMANRLLSERDAPWSGSTGRDRLYNKNQSFKRVCRAHTTIRGHSAKTLPKFRSGFDLLRTQLRNTAYARKISITSTRLAF